VVGRFEVGKLEVEKLEVEKLEGGRRATDGVCNCKGRTVFLNCEVG
jgi:hypothetical protein